MRVFAAVAEHGSVSRAATSLHLTGPGISQHIRRLEQEIGATLVERDGRTIRLTPAGRALAVHAAIMSDHAQAGERDVAHTHTDTAGALRIGTVASALRRLVVPALAELVLAHPMLTPTVVDGEGKDLLDALQRKALDAVIFESWESHPAVLPLGATTTTLLTETVHLAVPKDDRTGTQHLTSLSTEPWTVCPKGSDAHTALLQVLRETGTEPHVAYELSDYASQLAVVEAGMAIALIPETARDPDVSVTYLATEPPINRTLRIAASSDIPAVAALERALRNRLSHQV